MTRHPGRRGEPEGHDKRTRRGGRRTYSARAVGIARLREGQDAGCGARGRRGGATSHQAPQHTAGAEAEGRASAKHGGKDSDGLKYHTLTHLCAPAIRLVKTLAAANGHEAEKLLTHTLSAPVSDRSAQAGVKEAAPRQRGGVAHTTQPACSLYLTCPPMRTASIVSVCEVLHVSDTGSRFPRRRDFIFFLIVNFQNSISPFHFF